MNQQAFRAKNGFQVNGAETKVNQSLVFGGKTISELLFTQNEPGFTFLANPETCFTDVAGTINAGPGEPVALWLDQSGNDNHATQPTSANRPILGRKPKGGRRNLLERTEDLTDGSYWSTLGGLTVTDEGDGVFRLNDADDTTSTRYAIRANSGSFIMPDGPRTISVDVKAGTISKVIFAQQTSGTQSPTNTNSTVFDMASGEFILIGASFVATSVADLGDGWFRISASRDDAAGGSFRGFSIGMNDNDYIGDGTGTVFVRFPQAEVGLEPTAYQRVGSQFDVTEAGVPDRHYLFFGGASDPRWMQTPTITPGTDKAQVFAGARKLSDAENGRLLEAVSGDGRFSLQAPFSSTIRYGFSSRGNGSNATVSSTSDDFKQPHSGVLVGLSDVSAPFSQLRINGSVIGTDTTTNQGVSSGTAREVRIGARSPNNDTFFNGEISALTTRFGPNLATEQINRVESITAYHVAEPTI